MAQGIAGATPYFGTRNLMPKRNVSAAPISSSTKSCSYCALNCTGVPAKRTSFETFAPSGRLAMAAGISDYEWSIEKLVGLLEARENEEESN